MRLTANYRPTLRAAALLNVLLLLVYLPFYQWDMEAELASRWLLLFLVNVLLLVPLLVRGEPALICVDSAAKTLTYGMLLYPRKVVVNYQVLRGEISRQRSHSGSTYFCVLFADNKQVLAIKATERWPQARLARLQHMLETQHQKARC